MRNSKRSVPGRVSIERHGEISADDSIRAKTMTISASTIDRALNADRQKFALKGIDSDNGSEFINNHMIRFCRANSVTFTRSRPNKKNDSCYVEQKNWSLVRVTVGYARYDTQDQTDLLNRLYGVLRLYSNYFQPVMTLASKERNGSKVTRRYDEAKTPYQRTMLHPDIPDTVKEMLTAEYQKLNPASLRRQITQLQAELAKTVRRDASQASPPEACDDTAGAKES